MRTPLKPRRRSRHAQAGFSLLESLCALLLFSVGVLGVVGLQSTATRQATAAEFRSTAAMLANDLIARMWLSDRTAATLQASYDSDKAGTGYTSWLAAVRTSGLPGVSDLPPSVHFQTVSGGGTTATASSLATITISWKAPGDTSAHQYTALAQLK